MRNHQKTAIFFSARFLLPSNQSSNSQKFNRLKMIPWALFLIRSLILVLCIYACLGLNLSQKTIDLYWSSPPTIKQIAAIEKSLKNQAYTSDYLRFFDISKKSYSLDSLYQIPFSTKAQIQEFQQSKIDSSLIFQGIHSAITAIEQVWENDLEISFSLDQALLDLQKKDQLKALSACLSLKNLKGLDQNENCFAFQQSNSQKTLFELKIPIHKLYALNYSPYQSIIAEIKFDASDLKSTLKIPNIPICIAPKQISINGDFSWFEAFKKLQSTQNQNPSVSHQADSHKSADVTWLQSFDPSITQTLDLLVHQMPNSSNVSPKISSHQQLGHTEDWFPWVHTVEWGWQSSLSTFVVPMREANYPQPSWTLQNVLFLNSFTSSIPNFPFLWAKKAESLVPIASDFIDLQQGKAIRILGFDPKQIPIDIDVLSLMMARAEKDIQRFAQCRNLNQDQQITIHGDHPIVLKSPSGEQIDVNRSSSNPFTISANQLKEFGFYQVQSSVHEKQIAMLAYQPYQASPNQSRLEEEQKLNYLSERIEQDLQNEQNEQRSKLKFQKWILLALIGLVLLLNLLKRSLITTLVLGLISFFFFFNFLQIRSLFMIIEDQVLAQKWQNALISADIDFSKIETEEINQLAQHNSKLTILSDHIQHVTNSTQWLIPPKKRFPFFKIKDIQIQPSFDQEICQIQVIFDSIGEQVDLPENLKKDWLNQSIDIEIYQPNDELLASFKHPIQAESSISVLPCISKQTRENQLNPNANPLVIDQIKMKISTDFSKNWLKDFNALAQMLNFDIENQQELYRLKLPPTAEYFALAYGLYAEKYALNAGFKVSGHLYALDALNDQIKAIFLDHVDLSQISNLQVHKLREWLEAGGTLFLSGSSSFTKGNLRNHPLESLSPVLAESRKLGQDLKISILIDQSGSMSREAGGIGLDQVRSKLIELISVLSDEDEIEIISFAGKSQVLVPKQKVAKIKEIPMPLESTGQSLLLTALEKMSIQSKINENHLILIISDGVFGDPIFDSEKVNLEPLITYQRPILMAYTQEENHFWQKQNHPLIQAIPFKQLTPQSFLNQAFLVNQKKNSNTVDTQILIKQAWQDQVGTEIPKIKSIDAVRLKDQATLWLQTKEQVVLASQKIGLGQVFALTGDDFELSSEAWQKLFRDSLSDKGLTFEVNINENYEIWLTQMDEKSIKNLKSVSCALSWTATSDLKALTTQDQNFRFKQMTSHSAKIDLKDFFDFQTLQQISSIKIQSNQGIKEIWLKKIPQNRSDDLSKFDPLTLGIEIKALQNHLPTDEKIDQIKKHVNQCIIPFWAWILLSFAILLEVLMKK